MTITDKQVEAAEDAIVRVCREGTVHLLPHEVAALARAALEASEAAAWSSDMEAAPKDGTPVVMEHEDGVSSARFGTKEDIYDAMTPVAKPKRWRHLPTPPAEDR